jgi:DNA replication protein DnaC
VGFYSVDVGDDIHHPWFGKLFPCVCRQKQIVTHMQTTVGSELLPVRFNDIEERGEGSRRMKQAAQLFIHGNITSLTIYGTNGNGKTTTLMAIANALLDNQVGALYITAADAMAYIKGGIGLDFNDFDRMEKLIAVPVLLLDELTQVVWTPYVTEKLETVLDRRYRGNKPIAMAMDQDPEDVLSPRFASRMRSGAYIKISEPDMRADIGRVAAMDRGER